MDHIQPGLLGSLFYSDYYTSCSCRCDDYSFTFSHISYFYSYINACVFCVNSGSNVLRDSAWYEMDNICPLAIFTWFMGRLSHGPGWTLCRLHRRSSAWIFAFNLTIILWDFGISLALEWQVDNWKRLLGTQIHHIILQYWRTVPCQQSPRSLSRKDWGDYISSVGHHVLYSWVLCILLP